MLLVVVDMRSRTRGMSEDGKLVATLCRFLGFMLSRGLYLKGIGSLQSSSLGRYNWIKTSTGEVMSTFLYGGLEEEEEEEMMNINKR